MKPRQDAIEYAKRISLPALSRTEEIEIGRLIEHGDPSQASQARGRLVRSMAPLAIRAANEFVAKYKNVRIEAEEAVAAALLGVVEAATRFDFAKGTRFSTYAKFWIRCELMKLLRGTIERGFHTYNLDEVYAQEHAASLEEDVLSRMVREESLRDLGVRMSKLADVERTCLAVAAGLEGSARSLGDVAKDCGLKNAWAARGAVKQAFAKLGGEPADGTNYGFTPRKAQGRKRKRGRRNFNLHRWLIEQVALGPIDHAEAFRLAAENRYKSGALHAYICKHRLCITVLNGRKVITHRPETHGSA